MDDSVSDETQFIHGRKLHLLRPKDVAGISSTYYNCRNAKPGEAYEDISGFCKYANIDEIATHDFVLTPGRYVGAADIEDDGESIEEKLTRLRSQLLSEFDESVRLEQVIRARIQGLIRG
jgi:type I restriction enzyme M protein